MNMHTILPSALLITLCNIAPLQGTPSVRHLARKDSGWRSARQEQPYQTPTEPVEFERQRLSQEPTCFWGILLLPGDQARTREFTRSRCRRSEEHTSELQSRRDLVCRLLLEKK